MFYEIFAQLFIEEFLFYKCFNCFVDYLSMFFSGVMVECCVKVYIYIYTVDDTAISNAA